MNTQSIYLALYRGRRDGTGWRVWIARATDWLTRKITRGQYSHCEIAFRLPENDAAGETIASAFLWAMDKPMHPSIIEDIIMGINAKLAEYVNKGYILGARVFLDNRSIASSRFMAA